MEYGVIHHRTSIKVLCKGWEYIDVSRQGTWTARLVSRFYKDGDLILESSVSTAIFSRSLIINYQKLAENIVVSKNKRAFTFICGKDVLRSEQKIFKNPIYLLYRNDEVCGEVYQEPFGISLPPYKYRVVFKKDQETNLYSLLTFLMELPDYE